MNTPVQSAGMEHGDEFNQSPQALIQWLEAKYQRHHEDEDRQAAELLKKLIAEKPADNSRAIASGAKRQAKRLLKLSKERPLKLTALNEALEVVSILHGYPNWQALSTSANPSERTSAYKCERTKPSSAAAHKATISHVLINEKSHARDLSAMLSGQDGIHTLITPHFSRIHAPNSVARVSLDRLSQINPFLSPLGMEKMLPAHRNALSTVLVSVLPDTGHQIMRGIISSAIDLAFEEVYSGQNARTENPSQWPHMFPVSNDTLSKIAQLGAISARDATHYLIETHEIEAAREIHALCMPRIGTILGNLEKAGIQSGISREAWAFSNEQLIKIWGRSKITNSPFDLPMDQSWIIELDPTDVDHPLPAETRWILATFLDQYRYMSHSFNEAYHAIAANAYRCDISWATSIPSKLRQDIVKLHADQATNERKKSRTLFLDEMDGPIHSQKICDVAGYIIREYPKSYNSYVSIATKAQKSEIASVNAFSKSGILMLIPESNFNQRMQ